MVAPFVDVLMQFIVPMLVGTLVIERRSSVGDITLIADKITG